MQWHLQDFENVGFGFFVAVLFSLMGASLGAYMRRRELRDIASNSKRMVLANEKQGDLPEEVVPKRKPVTGAPAPERPSSASPLIHSRQERALLLERHNQNERYIKLAVVIILSVVIVASCIYLMITSQNQENIKWAQSTIALILGYWLRALR